MERICQLMKNIVFSFISYILESNILILLLLFLFLIKNIQR